jgi:GntR family transcriptional regulator
MPARVNFTDAGVAFDADGALAPAAQLVAKLRLAIDAGAIPEGATMPSIRAGAEELGVHSNTLRKVYAALEAQGYATTGTVSGTVCAAGAAGYGALSPTARSPERAAGRRCARGHGHPGRSRHTTGARLRPGRAARDAPPRRRCARPGRRSAGPAARRPAQLVCGS